MDGLHGSVQSVPMTWRSSGEAERDFFWFHSVLGAMGTRFFFTREVFFPRVVSAKKIFLVFFVVFLGCFRALGFFFFRALARIFSVFFFRRRHEQNREFPLCGEVGR